MYGDSPIVYKLVKFDFLKSHSPETGLIDLFPLDSWSYLLIDNLISLCPLAMTRDTWSSCFILLWAMTVVGLISILRDMMPWTVEALLDSPDHCGILSHLGTCPWIRQKCSEDSVLLLVQHSLILLFFPLETEKCFSCPVPPLSP